MKKQKFNLETIKVQSFVTELKTKKEETVKGGGFLSIGVHCSHVERGCYGTDRTKPLFCGRGSHDVGCAIS